MSDNKSVQKLGKMVVEYMTAGMSREDAVKQVASDITRDPTTALTWLERIGYRVVADAFVSYRHSTKGTGGDNGSTSDGQPEQLTKDKRENVDQSRLQHPTGPDGVYKTMHEYTRDDLQRQLESLRKTVRGLRPRIEAGETLHDRMEEDEVVAETLEREGEPARKEWMVFTGQTVKVE